MAIMTALAAATTGRHGIRRTPLAAAVRKTCGGTGGDGLFYCFADQLKKERFDVSA